MNIEIANRLVILRKQKGFSQEDLAIKLGISRQAVSKWERAESSPDTDNLILLSKLYNISLDELLQSDIESIENEKFASQGYVIADGNEPQEIFEEHEIRDTPKKSFNVKTIYAAYPMITVFLYLSFGCILDIWHPTWLIFLTIPIFYTVNFPKKK